MIHLTIWNIVLTMGQVQMLVSEQQVICEETVVAIEISSFSYCVGIEVERNNKLLKLN